MTMVNAGEWGLRASPSAASQDDENVSLRDFNGQINLSIGRIHLAYMGPSGRRCPCMFSLLLALVVLAKHHLMILVPS